MSIKFLSAILGPEMAAPILWTRGNCVLSAGKPLSIKFLVLGGGGYFGFLGGGSADFIFMGARIFAGQNFIHPHPPTPEITLLGVGAYKRGGAYKIPAAWGLKIYTPTPPPLENAFCTRSGGGGGGRI